MSDQFPFKTLKPSTVLYYYDEPLIFLAETQFTPVLVIKVNEDEATSQYLAVSSSQSVVDQLRKGNLSLRAAFSQPWCWLLWLNTAFEVLCCDRLPLAELDQDFLPKPGVGLFAHHGYVRDEASTVSIFPLLRFTIKSEELDQTTINTTKFEKVINELYGRIWEIASVASYNIIDRPSGEISVPRLHNDTPYRSRLAPLNLLMTRQGAEYSLSSNKTDYNVQVLPEEYTIEGNLSVNELKEQTSLTQGYFLSAGLADYSSQVVNISELIVSRNEIILENTENLALLLRDVLKYNENVIEDIKKVRVSSSVPDTSLQSISGKIIQFNTKRKTFILVSGTGREITCLIGSKIVEKSFTLFKDNTLFEVTGLYQKRSRRDYMAVKSITLPGGEIISR